MSKDRRLIIVIGQEGVGEIAIVSALLPYGQPGAAPDAEEVGQVNPWRYKEIGVG